jgi:hypothetical protein
MALRAPVGAPPFASRNRADGSDATDGGRPSNPPPPGQKKTGGASGVPQVLELRQDQMDRLIQQLKSDKPKLGPFEVGDLASLFAVLLAACAIYATWFIAHTQARINSRQTAVNLHSELYGVEYYIHVVAPTAGVRMKWMYLPEPDRGRHRQEVVKGWAHYADDPSNIKRYAPESALGADFGARHFSEQGTRQSLTEHQALSAFLHFWSNLAVLIKTGLADKAIWVSLFADAYRYNLQFVRQLRDTVLKSLGPDDVVPAWIANTRSLEEILSGSVLPSIPKEPVAEPAALPREPETRL